MPHVGFVHVALGFAAAIYAVGMVEANAALHKAGNNRSEGDVIRIVELAFTAGAGAWLVPVNRRRRA